MPALPSAFSPAAVSRVALANAVANGVIVVTGGAVRLTGSGLGCPTWPRCTGGSLVPTPELAGHGVDRVQQPDADVRARRRRRSRPSSRSSGRSGATCGRWPSLSFLGIPAQALLGGVTVLTGLNPWTVAAHFLLSMVLVARRDDAVAALPRAGRRPAAGPPSVRAARRRRSRAVTAAVLVVGTVVTGSGPHSGDPKAGRTGFDPELVSQLHADLVFLLVGLTVALLVALAATDSPGRVRRAARDLLIVELAQGVDRLRAVLHRTCRSRWCWCTCSARC